MRLFKRFILLLIAAASVLLCSCKSTPVDFGNMQVVNVLCENQKGSGVIYEVKDGQVWIVTAAHVVEGAKIAKVVVDADQKHYAETETIFRVEGLDLAFLQLDDAICKWSVLENGQIDEPFERLTMIGYDGTGNLHETEGSILEEWIYVEDFQSHMTCAKGLAEAGMSGGAAFDEDGNFVGIICGMDENNNIAILPDSVIRSEYQVLDK